VTRAVFLDRDGTMIRDIGYLHHPDEIEFFPWTVDAIRALNAAGFVVVVTTNQSGIARGRFSEEQLAAVHAAMARVLEAGRASVRAYYYCPHHPNGTIAAFTKVCDCRKPAGGMVERAVRELGVDPSRSFVVGDTWLDIGLARSCGATGILVRTGAGAKAETHPEAGLKADVIVDNLAAAASWILQSQTSEIEGRTSDRS
jgi:D-glycero-D-manno-heptose 1,7-bisphosphate phosphatase